jgi:hypothetical protein
MAKEKWKMILHNGINEGEPIGHLTGPNGEIVSVWSANPVNLMDAMTQAIEPVPSLPSFGLGGSVEVIYPTDPFSKAAPQAIYVPAGDVKNQELFDTQVKAWTTRAQMIQGLIVEMVKAQKAEDKPKKVAKKK